jgi:hypothetical protein
LSSYIGGVRLNHEAGGVIEIEVAVDAPSAQRAAFVREMSAEVPGGNPVTAVTVTHSSEELLGVVERITSDCPPDRSRLWECALCQPRRVSSQSE